MCAARPIIITPFPSAVAAVVGATQPGREQFQETCLPSLFFVASVKSSLLPAKTVSFPWVHHSKIPIAATGACLCSPFRAYITFADALPGARLVDGGCKVRTK